MGHSGKRLRQPQIDGQFAPRLIEMLESAAWRALSLSAHRVLDRLEIEIAKHGGTGNGDLICPYDDFERYGIDRHAIGPALRELAALGFIEVTDRGVAGNAEFRAPSRYRLTYRSTGRHNATHDWRRIDSVNDAAALARAARASQPQKTKSQWGKTPDFSGGNPHRKRKTSVGETHTTGPVGETHTTLDIMGTSPSDRIHPSTSSATSCSPPPTSCIDREAAPSGAGRRTPPQQASSAPHATIVAGEGATTPAFPNRACPSDPTTMSLGQAENVPHHHAKDRA